MFVTSLDWALWETMMFYLTLYTEGYLSSSVIPKMLIEEWITEEELIIWDLKDELTLSRWTKRRMSIR